MAYRRAVEKASLVSAPFACGAVRLTTTLEVLLVEPDPDLVESFRVELQPFAAKVHALGDFDLACALVERTKLDATLISLDYPGLDSNALITAVRRSKSNGSVPVVALVPHDKLGLLERASRAGASHFLPKPVVWTQMRQLVLSIHWRMVDERRHYRRAAARFPVLCTFDGSHRIARSVNLSSRGMLLQLDRALPAGKSMVVAFPYSELAPAPFMLQALVTRLDSDPAKVAVEFVETDAAVVERLRMWVDLFVYFEGSPEGKPGPLQP
jgi:CheY-like chemotaxis protein